MEVLEAIKNRRSIRKYSKKSVPYKLIYKILEAGRWAPSANNSQHWQFILLKNEKIRREVANATTYGKFLADASIGIVVVITPEASNHPVEDGSAATQNMLLAAYALGLGSCWIGAYESSYEVIVKKILNVPNNKRILSIISIGYPAESPQKPRKELKEMLVTY